MPSISGTKRKGPRQRLSITVKQKIAIIEKCTDSSLSLEELGIWAFDMFKHQGIWKPVSTSTISRIISKDSKEKVQAAKPYQHSNKQLTPCALPELEKAILEDIKNLKVSVGSIDHQTLQIIGQRISSELGLDIPQTFKFSKGWAKSFLKRIQVHS